MTESQYIIDVTEENFASEVIEASHQYPVLVDFWATWCGPCQSLMPVLAKLAQEYAGKFIFAKVEIDQQQGLASQFGVRSVPTVKLVKDGQIVDEFSGALPEAEIRKFIDKHLDHPSDNLMQAALLAYQQGQTGDALAQMQQIILDDAQNEQNRIIFATILMREGRADDARQLLDSLSADAKAAEEASALYAQLEFVDIVSHAPDIETLQKAINSDPANVEARHQLSAHYMLLGEYEAAMENLLEIVKRDRSYQDDIGRKTLLKVFEALGPHNELVSKYRRMLAIILN